VSPILVRPVREQLEHDRVVRALQARFKRKFDVAMNIGADETSSVKSGHLVLFPDLVLTSTGRNPKPEGLVEVETAESVNHLEALALWAHFGKVRLLFSLYVPAGSVEQARRLSADHQIHVDELWSYHTVGSQIRFTLVHRASVARTPAPASRARTASARRPRPAARKGAGRAHARPAATPNARARKTARTPAGKPARSRKR
jgi:hypothetical protein